MKLSDLNERISLNFDRLNDEIYGIDKVFQPRDYAWQGDFEGRALLAFACLYRMTGKEIPTMHKMVEMLSLMTDGNGYFGKATAGVANEQQLSGHSWYLRGLIAYDSEFPSDTVKEYMKNTFEALYYTALDAYAQYPLRQDARDAGDVSGDNRERVGKWELSTDVGCSFMAVDGISDYYSYTRDPRAKELFEVMADVCMRFDRIKSRAQTHATLSAARGMLRFYRATDEEKYLGYAKELFELYEREGMTLTYENYNWFLRPLWSEPCCIVDSLILAVELYRITKDGHYRTLARRVLHNGLAFCQRSNGGAGTNSCARAEEPYLYAESCYEAFFCCSMRLSEGLLCASQNKELLFDCTDLTEGVTKDGQGRYFCNDILLCEDISESGVTDAYLPEARFKAEGKTLIPLIQLYKLPEDKAKRVKLRVAF